MRGWKKKKKGWGVPAYPRPIIISNYWNFLREGFLYDEARRNE